MKSRGIACAALLVSLATLGLVPTSSSAEPVAGRPPTTSPDDPDHTIDGGGLAPELPPAPSRARRAFPPTNGWNPLAPEMRFKARPTYSMRLIAGNDVERLRPVVEAAVLANPFVDVTVVPGTVGRSTPQKGEILVSVSETSPCTSQTVYWVGCGGPKKSTWVKGTNYTKAWVNAGRVWIRPNFFTDLTSAEQLSTVLHELGHVFGMGHIEENYEGARQIMYPVVGPTTAYQSGDRNGLRSARGLEKGWRNFRSRAVEVARFNNEDWLIGADAEGKVWARHAGARWQSIGGILRGAPATITQGGKLHVFGVGTDGDVYRNSRYGGKWHGWVRIAAEPDWMGGVSAIVGNVDRIHIYGRNAATRSAQQLAWNGSTWVLSDLGGAPIGDIGAMYVPSSNAHSLWAVGANGLLYQQNWTPSGSWTGWFAVAGSPGNLDGGVTAIRDGSGRYRLAVVKTSGKIQHASWTAARGWKFWLRETRARGRVGLAKVPGSDRIRVYVPSWEGHVRVSTQTKSGWTGFKIAGPS